MSYENPKLNVTLKYETSEALSEQKIKDQLRVMGYVSLLNLSIGEAEALIEDLQRWIRDKKLKGE